MEPILREAIPKQILAYTGQLVGIQFPKQGCTSDVAILQGTQGKYVLKRSSGEQYSAWLRKESEILKILSSNVSFVPMIYQAIHFENETWVLMEYIAGTTLREALQTSKDESTRENLIYQFGKVLRLVHDTPCPEQFMQTKPWLDSMLEEAAFNIEHYPVDGSKELLGDLRTNRPKAWEQTLIHGDFTVDNVMVHHGKITKIIDWSGGGFGDPRYDAALAIRMMPAAFEKESDKAIFFKGYGNQILDQNEYRYFAEGLYEFF